MDNRETEARPGFTFFRSFQEAIDQCEVKDQLALYKGIVSYALDGAEPSFDNPLLRMAWTLIKPNLDKGWVKYRNAKKSEGVPKLGMIGNQNARKEENQSENKAKTKQNQSENKALLHGKEKEKERNNIETNVSLCKTSESVLQVDLDFDKFLICWNSAAKDSNLKSMAYWTPKRKSHLQARYQDCIRASDGDNKKAKEMLFKAIKNAKSSEWLNGEGLKYANFDWIFTHPNNFVKVLDGHYNS